MLPCCGIVDAGARHPSRVPASVPWARSRPTVSVYVHDVCLCFACPFMILSVIQARIVPVQRDTVTDRRGEVWTVHRFSERGCHIPKT